MSRVYDDVMNIFNGQTPIKRQNPGQGESQYYYINPGQGNFTAFSEVKTTDIPDEKPLFNTGQSLQQVQTRNNYFQMPHSNPNNVIMGAVTGVGDGFIGGTERFINDLTQGGYGQMIDSTFDKAYTNRQNRLQNQADQTGMGNVNRLANMAIGTSATLIPWVYGLGKFIIK